MGKAIKTKIRDISFYLLSKLLPELNLLRDKSICWDYISSRLTDSVVGKFVKIYPPYNIGNAEIGEGTYLAANSFVSIAQIGKYCSIGPNFSCGWGVHPTDGLSTSPMFYSTVKQNGRTLCQFDKIEERKKITIGNDVFIGANVIVLDGVVIGDGAIIGAGAVVSKDIPPYSIAVGCPIKIIKYRFKQEDIDRLLKIKWWNFEENELKDVEKYFYDINTFLDKYNHRIQTSRND